MKIKVTHDKTGRYVAELVGIEGAYTQAKTPEKAVEYLFGVYKDLQDIKVKDEIKSMKGHKILKKLPKIFSKTEFSKFELAL